MMLAMRDSYQVIGVESSPYTVKVRAVLRYRHLPHTWLCRFPQFYPPTAHVRPALMPVVRFPDGELRVDSTTILFALEALHPERSLIPADPVLALYAFLLEDMADEYLTKLVYFFRFGAPVDRVFGSQWVTDDSSADLGASELERRAQEFVVRQDGRRTIVGVRVESGAHFEATYRRLLEALNGGVGLDRFLFGSRPSLADFGIFGQLHTLSSDPTPSAILRSVAPRVEYWVRRAHDLSGVDGRWQSSPAPSATVVSLLRIVGDTYLPFLRANFVASAQGAPAFRYHVKCWRALRSAFATLTPADRERACPLLRETGCLELLEEPEPQMSTSPQFTRNL